MKLKILFCILFTLLTIPIYAQQSDKKDKVKALKIAFITTELSLTSDEAEKFWPLYNSFDNKQYELRKYKLKAAQQRINSANLKSISDKEATALLQQIEDADDEIYQLRKKFNANLRTVISPVKIIRLKKAEDDFNRKLLRQYRDQRKK